VSPTAIRAVVVTIAATYVGAIHWSYVTIISPLFDYNGALYRPASDGSLMLAFLVSILPAFWLPVVVSRPSQVAMWVLYVLAYIPSILIPYYVLGTGFEGVLPLTLAVAFSFALLALMVRVQFGASYVPTRSMHSYESLALGLAIVLGMYIILAFGLKLDLPGLANVYDVRSAFDQAVSDTSVPFVAYAVDWSLYVANPLLILLGLRSKRWGLFAIGLAIELLVYGTTGYKSALLSIMLVVPLVVLLSRRLRPAFGLSLPAASVVLVLGSVIWDHVNNSTVATFLFIHRAIALPGQLVADYYDFFSQHQTFGLSGSILSFLGPAPYTLQPPKLIGAVYFNAPNENANANLWADAFANFGIGGIIAFTIVLGLVLLLLDSAASGRDLRVTGALAGLMAIVLSNSALLTTILSHGLALAILLIVLMPQDVETKVQDVPGPDPVEPDDRLLTAGSGLAPQPTGSRLRLVGSTSRDQG
jgi:hypothetical protein